MVTALFSPFEELGAEQDAANGQENWETAADRRGGCGNSRGSADNARVAVSAADVRGKE